MYKRFSLILAHIFLLASCDFEGNDKNSDDVIAKSFDNFHYVYHFYKQDFTESRVEPAAYKPKVFDIKGTVYAQIYSGDTLIRFVYKSKSEKLTGDSTVELFRPVKLEKNVTTVIPTMLLGCHLLGIYNSNNEDIPDNFYYCFYANDKDDLLNVVHMYKPGNVSAAFFYVRDSIDATVFKKDVARLLVAERPFSLTDTLKAKFD